MMKMIKKNKMEAIRKDKVIGVVGFVVFSILFFVPFSSAVAQEFVVIINPDCPTIGKDEIKAAFLGYRKSVGGYPVELYITKDEGTFSKFVQTSLNLKVSDFNSHWLKRALAGEGAGPRRLSDDEIIFRVKDNRCAIGVISSKKAPPSGVKVLLSE